jgi:hypothetical protein
MAELIVDSKSSLNKKLRFTLKFHSCEECADALEYLAKMYRGDLAIIPHWVRLVAKYKGCDVRDATVSKIGLQAILRFKIC